jgi:DNA-binding MarR family transcriptional regulator
MEHERSGFAFLRMARYVIRVYNRHLADVHLTASQHCILESLREISPISLQDLADRIVVERSALQRTIQPLKKDNLVRSLVDPAQTRRLLYELTDDGRRRLESSAARVYQAEAEIEAFLQETNTFSSPAHPVLANEPIE